MKKDDEQNMIYNYNGVLFSIRKEILTHAIKITCVNLENIMLSDMSQKQKDK